MAPKRKASAGSKKSSTSSIRDVFKKTTEEVPETRLAIRTREGENVVKLPAGTRVLVIHNSDLGAQPHHLELGEVTLLGPARDFLKWYCYAVLTAAVCLGLAGLLLFFLFPRRVEIETSGGRHYPHYRSVVLHNTTDPRELKNAVSLKYHLKFRVVNNNYIPITIEEVNCRVQAFEVVQPNPYKNTSRVEVPLRSDVNLTAHVDVFLSHQLGFMAKQCNDRKKLSHTLTLKLDVTVRYRTLLGREGRTMTPSKEIASCGPEGSELPGGRTVEEEEWRQIMEGGDTVHEGKVRRVEGDGTNEVSVDGPQVETDMIDQSEALSPEGRTPASPASTAVRKKAEEEGGGGGGREGGG